MPEVSANGIRLHYEEQGGGTPILCMHGTGTSASVWGDAVDALARLGRVIAYDRRGHMRSERPKPYERASVAEQADDAAALLDQLAGEPAVVIGRSYGGAVALELANRHPDRVRALVLLEAVVLGLTPALDEWLDAASDRLREAAAQAGIDAVGEALVGEALGEGAWESAPEGLRRMFTQNGPAILAEVQRGALQEDTSTLATIDRPALLVAAADSPRGFREVTEAAANALPDARATLVGGGHMISPAEPEIMAFIEQVIASR